MQAQANQQPSFLTWAIADPDTASLQRLQIVKGWLTNGEHQQKVYNVDCSNDPQVNQDTHRCPNINARVNLGDCSTTANVGAAELKVLWQDADFVPEEEAFYYARALEKPGVPMVHLRSDSQRRGASLGLARNDTGARLVFAHMVQRAR